jgi:hypothetical protein
MRGTFRRTHRRRNFICVSAWHGPFDVEMDCIAVM